jgi:succinyl-CoA synthetase alpha subunit
MAILVRPDTKVICQGLTGRAGSFYTDRMVAYGTNVVGGVTPGKGGTRFHDLPVFDTVRDAVDATGADATVVFVPPVYAADAMIEAIEAGIGLVVCVTERVPVLDAVRVRTVLEGSRSVLLGPNSAGILGPGVALLGVMPTVDARQGGIGIASRSATLANEVAAQVRRTGLGQSTIVGVGGDPVHGLGLAACLELFLDDPATTGVIVISEIGGTEEEEVAEVVARRKPSQPVIALIVGRHAPPERRMGHAGAVIQSGLGSAQTKIAALQAAGVHVVLDASLVGQSMFQAMTERSR